MVFIHKLCSIRKNKMETYKKTLYLTILFQLVLNIAFGQKNESSISGESSSNGLKVSVDSLNKTFSILEKKATHLIQFSYKNKDVTYYAFDYAQSDSTIFSKVKMKRLSMENCSWTGNNNPKKNFPLAFVKGDYYYLLEFCPCGASSKGRCAGLALKLNRWLENIKTEHNKS